MTMKKSFQNLLRWTWCLLIFILPLRWPFPAVPIEQPNFPLSAAEWIFMTMWPHLLLPVIAGALLLLSLIAWPKTPTLKTPSAMVPLLTLSPLLLGLPGLIRTTESAFAAAWYWHFYTVALTAMALWWISRQDSKMMPWVLRTLALTCLYAVLEGWYQHFGGLEANFQQQLAWARENGQELSELMQAKMRQTRIYGHFADPNIYAAHLLLTGPVMLYELWHFGKRFTPPRLSSALLTAAGALLWLGALFWSGSRGAIVGLFAGAAVAIWMLLEQRLSRTRRIALLSIAAAAAVVMLAVVSIASSRKLETASLRLEYYSTAVQIFQRYPLTGAGIGEFFPWHMRLKGWHGDEARDAHSLFFAQLAQCGAAGALDALLRLAVPLLLAIGWLKSRQHQDQWRRTAVLAAWCAWNIHALLQFNDIVIATAVNAGFIGLAVFPDEASDKRAAAKPWRLRAIAIILALTGIWAAHRLPGEYALQRAERFLHDRFAAAAADKLAVEQPGSIWAPRTAAELALMRQDTANAVKMSELLVERTPHRASSWLWLAKSQFAHGDTAAAEKSLATAREWYPTSTNALFLQALMELSQTGFSSRLFPALHWKTELALAADDEVVILLTPKDGAAQVTSPQAIVSELNRLNNISHDGRRVRFTLNTPSTP